MNTSTPNLGDRCKDRVTGYEGICVSRHEYLNGCFRIALQSSALKDGRITDPCMFDVQQLDITEKGAVKIDGPAEAAAERRPGGDRDDPVRPSNPPER